MSEIVVLSIEEAEALGVDFIQFIKASINSALSASDWAMLSDNALSVSKKAEWKAYRQALRDLKNGDFSDSRSVILPPVPQ